MADQNDPKLLQQALREFHAFVASFDSVMLATVNAEEGNTQSDAAIPEASYAPVLVHEGRYYIFVSELALHTRNLLHNPTAALLFIEDETRSSNVFARQRASVRVQAEEVAREAEHWHRVINLMEEKFPKMMPLLRTLIDFHLLQLTPQSGSYTAGFGKAYELSGDGLQEIRHISRR